MALKKSPIHSYISGRKVGEAFRKVTPEMVQQHEAFAKIGIHISDAVIQDMIDGIGFDAADPNTSAPLSGMSAPSISTPVQFLQNWLPGFVRMITSARKIDELVGITTSGSWEDEEIVQGVVEPVGTAQPYSDTGNINLVSWNANFERRTVVRFEAGISVGLLEEARTARMRMNTSSEKRGNAQEALEIARNAVGFFGFNNGQNRTLGFLNDPALPAYVTVPATGTGSSTLWANKDYLAITGDIRIWMNALQVQSQDRIDPEKAPITIALPTGHQQYLSVVSAYGNSVRQWIRDNYPNLRIVSAPELLLANGGENVAYIYAETVDDNATDDSRAIGQYVPAKFQALGVEKRAKSYLEDYANATAGCMVKRPYCFYRATGL